MQVARVTLLGNVTTRQEVTLRQSFYHLQVRLTLLEDVNIMKSTDSNPTAKSCYSLHIPRPLIEIMHV